MNSPSQIAAFLALGMLTLVPAVLVVSLRNLLHAALCLGVSFVGVAGLYLLLNAEFIAAAQVLVYVGAITVLILFAIMLTQGATGATLSVATHSQALLGGVTAGVVMMILGAFIIQQPWPMLEDPGIVMNTPRVLGLQLLTTYIIPFEVSSVVLLVALVAAIALARDEDTVSVEQKTNTIYGADAETPRGKSAEGNA
jgi:NAD(P)H-quinone oxidoreductase subunit 6